MTDLAGRCALVTGSVQGIGLEIARAFAEAGAAIALHGLADAAQATAAVAELKAAGAPDVRFFGHDLADPQAAGALVREAMAWRPIDILVNNAGITRDMLAMRMSDADWDAVLSTNLSAVFRMSRAVMRTMMKQRYGRIVNITSVVGASGNPGQANYAAAKAGVAGMTRALAQELGSRHITVNCVAPGFIDTDMTRALTEAQSQMMLTRIPLGRLGKPEEIAHAVSFLASPLAAYITGAVLHVNGGMYMQ